METSSSGDGLEDGACINASRDNSAGGIPQSIPSLKNVDRDRSRASSLLIYQDNVALSFLGWFLVDPDFMEAISGTAEPCAASDCTVNQGVAMLPKSQ